MTGAPAGSLRHRIFLVPIRDDVDPVWAHEHWTGHHAMVFGGSPGLRGYTQNQPPRDAWSARTHICAEAWFDDRSAERAAFGSRYYRDVVVPDEDRFVLREQAWHAAAPITRSSARLHAFRVLVFGHSPESAADALGDWPDDAVDVCVADRPLPLGGRRPILGLWTDDRDRAEHAAARFGPLAYLTQPDPIIPAPHAPWNGAST